MINPTDHWLRRRRPLRRYQLEKRSRSFHLRSCCSITTAIIAGSFAIGFHRWMKRFLTGRCISKYDENWFSRISTKPENIFQSFAHLLEFLVFSVSTSVAGRTWLRGNQPIWKQIPAMQWVDVHGWRWGLHLAVQLTSVPSSIFLSSHEDRLSFLEWQMFIDCFALIIGQSDHQRSNLISIKHVQLRKREISAILPVVTKLYRPHSPRLLQASRLTICEKKSTLVILQIVRCYVRHALCVRSWKEALSIVVDLPE